MKKNVLGRTGLEVTELSLGTLILGRIQANLSIEDGAKPVARAMELGINFIDTAASYGSQPHVRAGLNGFLGEVLISTKSHGRTREAVRKDFETSLKELGRDYIDVYQLHLVNNVKELEERRDVVNFLVELKRQKLIRAIGASVHRVEGAKAVAGTEVVLRRVPETLSEEILGKMGALETQKSMAHVSPCRSRGSGSTR